MAKKRESISQEEIEKQLAYHKAIENKYGNVKAWAMPKKETSREKAIYQYTMWGDTPGKITKIYNSYAKPENAVTEDQVKYSLEKLTNNGKVKKEKKGNKVLYRQATKEEVNDRESKFGAIDPGIDLKKLEEKRLRRNELARKRYRQCH